MRTAQTIAGIPLGLQTVGRINRLALALRHKGVDVCVAIFPYEMQESADAAARYGQDGIRWSPSLLQGEPQRMIPERAVAGHRRRRSHPGVSPGQ